ncbi:nitrile hydratase subunit beta [Roseovarius sp. LXJ103]|uniref:nitrile hydratase subunit beta n=1 Tax=Roseovarius carneus TaxID=2853164 RepID=UPI000D60CFBB|nr:nitrile hydratase subunit beta [Roseovarius carneus]MBZ8117065.1 nitrile hydratase subunit beta [Roseovarius carneus]PWE37084.1 nitrile hydratase subunit beta [Pelagicola sp. LXJ1103]
MDGIHDMGWMHGFGPVPVNAEGTFDHPWQGRAFALCEILGFAVPYGSDEHRQAIERLAPAEYLTRDYFEKWMLAATSLVTGAGLVSADEVATGRKAFDIDRTKHTAIGAADFLAACKAGADMTFPDHPEKPRFKVGAQVRIVTHGPAGHTRVPRYLRGRLGRIEAQLGAFQFADAIAAGRGPDPQHCYTVVFDAAELWGEGSDTLAADLWEPYIEYP